MTTTLEKNMIKKVNNVKEYVPIVALPHTPPYKIHRYFARRPWNVFKQLIEVFSSPGDVVLDPFCGGGVTVYEGIKVRRNMVGFDLNPLSIFIVENMLRRGDCLVELEKAMSMIDDYLGFLYGKYNQVSIRSSQGGSSGGKGPVLWNELTFRVDCNYCGKESLLSNDNKLSNGRYFCGNKLCQGSKIKKGYIEPKNCKRNGYEYLCSATNSALDKKQVKIKFNERMRKDVEGHIKHLEKQIRKDKIKIPRDKIPMDWDRQHEDLLFRKGIKYFQQFFTRRNLLINLLLLNFIKNLDVTNETYEVLRLIYSSSLRDTNIMAFTNESWQSGKPTTWSKHAFWIPSQFCEVNVTDSFRKAFNRVKAALVFNEGHDYKVKTVDKPEDVGSTGNLFLSNTSIDDSHILDNSVDAIITDPPYGSNVQYLELSHFWHVWNHDLYEFKTPKFKKEAVSNRKKNFDGAKDMKSYEYNLFVVFGRCYDALKPGGNMALTFNNKDMGAWLALLISIFRARFIFKPGSLYFQEGVSNYKQTAHTKHEGSPYGDFIYVFDKDITKVNSKVMVRENELVELIDNSFKELLEELKMEESGKNEAKKRMFLKIIPAVESFVCTNSSGVSDHHLYSHFNKNYLKRLYR